MEHSALRARAGRRMLATPRLIRHSPPPLGPRVTLGAMLTIRRLKRHGGSLVVVIPRPFVEALGLSSGDMVLFRRDGPDSVILSRVDPVRLGQLELELSGRGRRGRKG